MASSASQPASPITYYRFDYDPGVRLLKLAFGGLWDEGVLAGFRREAAALRERVERAGHRDDGGRILIDLSAYPVQPKAITESIAMLLPMFGDRAGRVAVVQSSSAIQQMQMQRLLAQDKVRMFANAGDAMAWLEQSG